MVQVVKFPAGSRCIRSLTPDLENQSNQSDLEVLHDLDLIQAENYVVKKVNGMPCMAYCALTLYQRTQTFNDPGKKKPFENIVGKGENAGNQHFLLFPTMFSTLS